MKFFLPTILIIIAVALFFTYIDPTYETVKELRAEQATFDGALDRSKELIAVRDQLLSKYNSFSTNDLKRLEKLLPNHVDSVRLIIDIDSIAALYGLRIQDVGVSTVEDGEKSQPLGIVNLSFSVEAPYNTLKQFLTDIENSLRVLDVTSISFSASEVDLTKYNIAIKTYWLK